MVFFFLWRSCRKIHDCLDKGLEQCSKYMNIIIYSALPKNKKKTPNKTFLKSDDKHTHIQNTPSPPKKLKKKIKQHKHEQQNKKAHSFL